MERRRKARENDEEMETLECGFVLNGEEAEIRAVETGIQDNRYIEILSGLKESEQIIVGPYATVSR